MYFTVFVPETVGKSQKILENNSVGLLAMQDKIFYTF